MGRMLERVGKVAGYVIGPVLAATTAVRHARTGSPHGEVLRARVDAEIVAGPLAELAVSLAGPAIVRFSGALFKDDHGVPDVLGCAVRFRSSEALGAEPDVGDQDLLLATIKRPWTAPFAPLTTRVRDYLANHYFGRWPFDLPGFGRGYLRLRPEPAAPRFERRTQRLLAAVWRGEAVLHLEVGRGPRGPWEPLVAITLEGAAPLDERDLRFAPGRTGRGIRPRGLVHALRLGGVASGAELLPDRG